MKIVLVSGHSEQKVGTHNKELSIVENDAVKKICSEVYLRERDVDVDLVLKKRNKYLSRLPEEIASLDPDLVIEVHLNGANGKAQGCETLVMNYAKKSRFYAEQMQDLMKQEMGIRDRGIKPIARKDDGGYLLDNLCMKYDIPCMITETFFLDSVKNKGEYDMLIEKSVRTILRFVEEVKYLG